MGYTHYWYREKEMEAAPFKAIVSDFKRLVPYLAEAGVVLADWNGEGQPQITEDEIRFNGSSHCGHEAAPLVIVPWPAKGARGVVDSGNEAVAGRWFAGALLMHRACDGDCSYESVNFPRLLSPQAWQTPEGGKYFSFCKTAFRPYDLAVTALLVIAQHHLGGSIVVSSDGEAEHWADAINLCQAVLDYGQDFRLPDAE